MIKKEAVAIRFGRIFGTPLAKELAKFKVHPNTVTLSALILGVLAAFCFFSNQLLFGVFFFVISHILDCADGELARLTNQTSELGEKLDFRVDVLRMGLMYMGLWYSQYYLHEMWFIGGLIIFSHYCVMMFGYMFIQYESIFSSYYTSHDEGLLTFMILPFLTMFNTDVVRIGLPILILLQLVSYLVIFFKQKEKVNLLLNIKKTLKLVRGDK